MARVEAANFWATVRLLLKVARLRSVGRVTTQRELLESKEQKKRWSFGGLRRSIGFLNVIALLMLAGFVHGLFAWDLGLVLRLSHRQELERDGKIAVSQRFIDGVFNKGLDSEGNRKLGSFEGSEAGSRHAIAEEASRQRSLIAGTGHEKRLSQQLDQFGRDGFVVNTDDAGRLSLPRITPLGSMMGLGFLGIWFLMLAFQGEGVEMDLQRRRNPIWEWVLSHPVHPGALFLAEMLSPLNANPFIAGAPIFWMLILSSVHGAWAGSVAGLIVGAFTALAASCVSKTLEIAVLLRVAPRNRGAVLGIINWLGFSALFLALFLLTQRWLSIESVKFADAILDQRSTFLFGWLLGIRADGTTSLPLAVMTSSGAAAVLVGLSIWVSAWAADAGLGGVAAGTPSPSKLLRLRGRFITVRDPLWGKELLWFGRDRGAIVQSVLIPLTLAASQSFRFGDLSAIAAQSWSSLCGITIIGGTYFLQMLGPRSLVSEGQALWLPLTWPEGLDRLLKRKARLWALLSTVLVFFALAIAIKLFPTELWKILLVGVGWMIFSRSLAEKMVTLVSAPTASGEPGPIPVGQRFAALAGTLTFAIGVMSSNWHLAVLGVVFSAVSAAALWQNFQARLPFLFDPWSERLPPPPTLMHAMVAITAMLEGMGILSIALSFLFGSDSLWFAQAIAYGIAALATGIVTSIFLAGRGVNDATIWNWDQEPQARDGNLINRLRERARRWGEGETLLVALGVGSLLAVVGLSFEWLLNQIPEVHEQIRPMVERLATHPSERWWMLLCTTGFAPMAEEYLFRGLFYRALDREWGGWRAVLGSAVFFGVYHPPLSWIPVTLAGIVFALLFKVTGRLWPGVVVHTVYNAILTLTR